MKNLCRIILSVVGLCLLNIGHAAELQKSAPERQGMSSERLEHLAEMNHRYTDSGKIAGVLTTVVRNGKIVHQSAAGVKGVDDPRPIAMDDLFRIYSMSKPITAAAAMQLYEQGKFQLTDPVSKFVPELASLNVYEDGKLRPAGRQMTMQQLLDHTAGFSYGFDRNNTVDKMYVDADLWGSKDLDEFVSRLAELPLMFEPGSRWHYSVAVDVTGLVVQRLSGQPFDAYLEEHIFKPLNMVDTSFSVPAEKLERFLPNHSLDRRKGKPETITTGADSQTGTTGIFDNCRAMCDYEHVTLFSGGGGLVSTLRDYVRFAEAMRDGELDGARILSPKTVDYMRMNHLPASIQGRGGSGEQPTLVGVAQNGFGFGLGFGVVTSTTEQGVIGSVGEYYWGGAAGTVFWIDPVEDLVVVSMMQLMSGWPSYRPDLRVAVYQALLETKESL